MQTTAVILNGPRDLSLDRLNVMPPSKDDLVVEVTHSGISTGTEKLLWTGDMRIGVSDAPKPPKIGTNEVHIGLPVPHSLNYVRKICGSAVVQPLHGGKTSYERGPPFRDIPMLLLRSHFEFFL